MTLAELRHRRILRSQAEPTPEHYYGGCRNTWYGEPLHYCGICDFERHDKSEVLQHIQLENAKEE